VPCHAHKFDPIVDSSTLPLKGCSPVCSTGERPLRGGDEAAARREARSCAPDTNLEARLAALEPRADPAATDARRSAVSPRLKRRAVQAGKAKYVRFVVSRRQP